MLLLANTLTADMGMIPGLAFVGPAMGLPLSVLAGFIERPFYTRAGVQRHALWYSLQANCVSLGFGFAATLLFMFLNDLLHYAFDFFAVWPFFAVCVSILVERTYLQRYANADPTPIRWSWCI